MSCVQGFASSAHALAAACGRHRHTWRSGRCRGRCRYSGRRRPVPSASAVPAHRPPRHRSFSVQVVRVAARGLVRERRAGADAAPGSLSCSVQSVWRPSQGVVVLEPGADAVAGYARGRIPCTGCPSSHGDSSARGVPMQAPPSQASSAVQEFPSLHAAPSRIRASPVHEPLRHASSPCMRCRRHRRCLRGQRRPRACRAGTGAALRRVARFGGRTAHDGARRESVGGASRCRRRHTARRRRTRRPPGGTSRCSSRPRDRRRSPPCRSRRCRSYQRPVGTRRSPA